jgi:hypothetical protein
MLLSFHNIVGDITRWGIKKMLREALQDQKDGAGTFAGLSTYRGTGKPDHPNACRGKVLGSLNHERDERPSERPMPDDVGTPLHLNTLGLFATDIGPGNTGRVNLS